MITGKVVGTVVSTSKNIEIDGAKFLLVEICNHLFETKGDYLVALDLVSAGKNELVLISQSTSARETPETSNKAVDAIIVAIVDSIDVNETVVYRK